MPLRTLLASFATPENFSYCSVCRRQQLNVGCSRGLQKGLFGCILTALLTTPRPLHADPSPARESGTKIRDRLPLLQLPKMRCCSQMCGLGRWRQGSRRDDWPGRRSRLGRKHACGAHVSGLPLARSRQHRRWRLGRRHAYRAHGARLPSARQLQQSRLQPHVRGLVLRLRAIRPGSARACKGRGLCASMPHTPMYRIGHARLLHPEGSLGAPTGATLQSVIAYQHLLHSKGTRAPHLQLQAHLLPVSFLQPFALRPSIAGLLRAVSTPEGLSQRSACAHAYVSMSCACGDCRPR